MDYVNMEPQAAFNGQEHENEKKIFVGGLSWTTTEDSLRAYFEQFGDIREVIIMRDKLSGRSRGFGFVSFVNKDAVDSATQQDHVLDGRNIEAKRAIPKGEITVKTKKIFVGGVPSSVSDDEFRDYFAQFGTVTDAQIMKDRATSRSRGFGFVTFDHESAVEKCLETSHKLNNKLVEVKKAEPKRTMNTSAPYSPVYSPAYSPALPALNGYNYSAGAPNSPHASYMQLNSPGYPYILTNFNGDLLYYADVSQLELGNQTPNANSPILAAIHVGNIPAYNLNAGVSEVKTTDHY
eukprot:TRINITY_DN1804_c0_g1_i1.p1 TRINITY_DN1804_c0_g1~~TRINITY_DN1804_c0_g1_i1.p1  ORF type:complete len:293 (-),score=69.65 TRINITY_DN1804_c0_g1_i1:110-988(-)